MQQSPQAHDRQDDAAQIGQSEQARRHEGHMGQSGGRMISATTLRRRPEEFPRKLENQQIFEYLCQSLVATSAVSRRRKIGLFAGSALVC